MKFEQFYVAILDYIKGHHCLIISVTVLLEYINETFTNFHTEVPLDSF